MAKTTQTSSETKRQQLPCCGKCLHSNLIQYDNNPILAQCHKKPDPWNERFPYDTDVAFSPKNCSMYKYTDKEKPVEHLKSVRHYPMACYAKCQSQKTQDAA